MDMIGKTFCRLTVLERVGVNKNRHTVWLCECSCGLIKKITGYNLRSGHTKSCGCLQKEIVSALCIKNKFKHGHSTKSQTSKTYRTWSNMLTRCNNPKTRGYENYGGRGITVCQRWWKFVNFLEDMGEAPKGHQIDRTDNDGNYCKSNCRWVTPASNSRNKRSNHLVVFMGKTQCLSVWSKETGIAADVIRRRLKRGWSTTKSLTTPTGTASRS